MSSNLLLVPTLGDRCVSFTRSPDVAIYMAALDREDDEGVGAVLVFDRQRLASRFKIEKRCNGFIFREEAEEAIWKQVALRPGDLIATIEI